MPAVLITPHRTFSGIKLSFLFRLIGLVRAYFFLPKFPQRLGWSAFALVMSTGLGSALALNVLPSKLAIIASRIAPPIAFGSWPTEASWVPALIRSRAAGVPSSP